MEGSWGAEILKSYVILVESGERLVEEVYGFMDLKESEDIEEFLELGWPLEVDESKSNQNRSGETSGSIFTNGQVFF
jgi:hypothetical protein